MGTGVVSEDIAELVQALWGGHRGVRFTGQDDGERKLSGRGRGDETFSIFRALGVGVKGSERGGQM